MKSFHIIVILMLSVLLAACGKSRQPDFYILNPISAKVGAANRYTTLKIGIEAIRVPSFAEKPQLMIYDSDNRVQLDEYHQWVTSLDKNIKSVIKANFNTLLPGVAMEDAPWDLEFNPDYNVQIDIIDFKIDVRGNSSLRASYVLSSQGNVIKKYARSYHLKIPVVTVEALVKSMNTNLNAFSRDMARSLIEKR